METSLLSALVLAAGSGNDIPIDNLSFDQVPEPSAALLAVFRRR